MNKEFMLFVLHQLLGIVQAVYENPYHAESQILDYIAKLEEKIDD